MQEYLVKKYDTLWKIAREHGTTVEYLASINKLKGRQIHQLRIDQKLYLPDDAKSAPDSKLNVNFRGLDFKPITPQRIKVVHDGKERVQNLGPGESLILSIKDHAQGLKIWIEDFNKKMVAVLDQDILPIGHWNLNIDSRKVRTDGALQPKKGAAATTSSDVKQSTTHNAQVGKGTTAVDQSRIESGKPVQALATIYTAKNLRLQAGNEQYRPHLIAAADRHGLTPQALAALVDAEAAKKKGVWQERSNEGYPKRAQGLAQFFPAAWKDVFNYSDSLLHADCQKLSETDRLKKRHEAKYAIDGAAAYATLNLKNFEKRTNYQVAQLSAEDKAKVAYFLHHEGLTGALRLLGFGKAMDNDDVTARLVGQVGEEKASELIDRYDGDAKAAYKNWLFGYTDAKINVNNFIVDDAQKFAKAPKQLQVIVAQLAAGKPAPAATSQAPASPAAAPPKPAPAAAPKVAAPAPPAPAKNTAGSAQSKWHDPLGVCTLRTAKLASKKGAQFGMVRKNGTRAHQGIDLVAVPGTPIYAVADGVVYTAPAPDKKYAYGHTLILEVSLKDLPDKQAAYCRKIDPGSETIGFFYAHLSEYPSKSPKIVSAGDIIGKTGESGNAAGMSTVAQGAHLHFEVRLDPKKRSAGLVNRADPLPFIENCTNR